MYSFFERRYNMRIYMAELDGRNNKMIEVKDTENIVDAAIKATRQYPDNEITAIGFFSIC